MVSMMLQGKITSKTSSRLEIKKKTKNFLNKMIFDLPRPRYRVKCLLCLFLEGVGK